MRNILVGLLVFFAVAVGGCTLMVGGQPLFPQPPPPAMQAEVEMDYVTNGTPLVIDAYPGIPFYPRYVGGVIVPVAFIDGRYVNARGVVVIHQGPWVHPPANIIAAHKEAMRRDPAAFRKMPPNHPAHPTVKPVMEKSPGQLQKAPPPNPPKKAPPKKKCPANNPKC